MEISTYEKALEFINRIHDTIPVLVYYYHPEKCFSWRSPRDFPYCSQGGRRSTRVHSHYTVPDGYLFVDDVIIITTFNEFQTTAIIFNGISQGILRDNGMNMNQLYSKSEIIHFLNNFRGLKWEDKNEFPKLHMDDARAEMLRKRICIFEHIIYKMGRVEHVRGIQGIAVSADTEARLWQKLNRQKKAVKKGVYRLVGISDIY